MKKSSIFFILIFILIVVFSFSQTISKIVKVNEYLSVLYPNGGENWEVGKKYTIKWSSNTNKNLKVYLKWGTGKGGYFLIASDVSNTGTLPYYVKDTKGHKGDETKYFKVCIMSMDEKLKDCSNGYFSILTPEPIHIHPPYFRFYFPKGGELFQRGSNYTIKWKQVRGEETKYVKIYLQNENNRKRYLIATNALNSGSSNVKIPISAPDGKYRIIITSLNEDSYSKSPSFLIGGFDLSCEIKNVIKHSPGGTFTRNYITFEIWIMNKGTGIRSFVPIVWRIIRADDNRVLVQKEGGGFSNVYPNKYYVKEVQMPYYSFDKPLIIEVEVDPKNTLHESSELRKNNIARKKILYNMHIKGHK